ncbi:MAG: transposase [Anaerolineaceae bacterium]|nr:transposase [Anaerolineaceae bacterium]
MPGKPRQYSESGYMHLTVRGNGKQILFEEDSDYFCYIHLMKKFSLETHVVICAYCLMENHVHMLVYDSEKKVSVFMRKLDVSYAGYYNRKYDRNGHLFQGRFGSKAINDENYLLTVFRYILNNPRKAGICDAASYPWSSYNHYGNPGSFVDTKIIQELLGDRKEYEEFIAAKYEDEPELEEKKHDDTWALEIILEDLQVESGTQLQSYTSEKRKAAIQLLKEKGLSVRQIERLTGINRNTIQRA